MQVESYILQARVVHDDGTRALVIVQGAGAGDKFAEIVPEGVEPQGPVPTTIEPDLAAITTLCEAVAATHSPTQPPAPPPDVAQTTQSAPPTEAPPAA